MTDCDQELCQYWTGEGCACAVLGIDKAGRTCMPCEFGDHAFCTQARKESEKCCCSQ